MTAIALARRSDLRSAPLRALVAVLAVGVAGTGVAVAGGGSAASQPRVGVIVDGTRGFDAAAVAAARSDVDSLRRRDVGAELRVTRTPSESLAAAATLV